MWDPVWEKIFTSQNWGKYPGEELIRFVARNFYKIARRSDIRILEVGCGPGANLWFIAREGFSFAGIDGSPSAIGTAAQRLDEEVPHWAQRGQLVVGDIEKLPYDAGSFDAVIDNEAVYCNDFETSRRIYADCLRVLKSGGLLFSRTFSAGSWGDKTGTNVGRGYWRCTEGPLADKGPSRFTSIEDVPTLLTGFDVQSVEESSWTADDRRHRVLELIIHARKP